MGQNEKTKGLLKEFPPVSTSEWEELILKDLKGADYNKKLIWKSHDGILVKPYYREEDLEQIPHLDSKPGTYPYVRGNSTAGNPWLIRQNVDVDLDFRPALEKANYLFDHGVESVNFILEDEFPDEKIWAFINQIPFDKGEICFSGIKPASLLDAIESRIPSVMKGNESVKVQVLWDPIGEFMLSGTWNDEVEVYEYMHECIVKAQKINSISLISVNGSHYKNSGSTIVQELAFSLAQANDYMAELTELGLAANDAARQITFTFGTGPNYFFEIAKFRAARLLWSKILNEYGMRKEEMRMVINAESSGWNKTIYDPHVNLLRTTTESMSAILGGIHSLRVSPFDAVYGEPSEFSERLARNQQILLREESYLDKVSDPAGGTYYIENLTHSLAESAWKLFQQVEELGGLTEAFYQGWIQNEIVTSAKLRDDAVAQRREILLGINHYPDFNEQSSDQIQIEKVISRAPIKPDTEVTPLFPYRGAEAFELLRLAVGQSGHQPVVFLLTIGNLAMRRARAGFASNFFGCAGYKIVDNNGFDTIEEGIRAAQQAHADMVVLCASDDEYATQAPQAKNIIGDKMILVVAGYPVDLLDQLKLAGVEHFIHVKSQVLETLKGFNRLLNIPVTIA